MLTEKTSRASLCTIQGGCYYEHEGFVSRLSNLLRQVETQAPQLAADLKRETDALSGRRAFGLNFERHIPETVVLPGRPVRKGDKVRFLPERGTKPNSVDRRLWRVGQIRRTDEGRVAELFLHQDLEDKHQTASRLVDDLVVVAEFRDPIYPGLMSTGKVERGGDRPFHTVINAENFHALQVLLYTHEGRVDTIYIDPPYNSRARDWKYNNDYVDPDDAYRHSKWLAMMERRLKLSKRLLNPDRSVLIVAIDEKEYLRLGLLLEQTFPEAQLQMISTIMNPKGVGRQNEFSRTNEYLFVLLFGDQPIVRSKVDTARQAVGLDWQTFRRRDLASARGTKKGGKAQFYPIYVNIETGRITHVGEPLPHDIPRDSAPQIAGCEAVFPVRPDGTEMNWATTAPTFRCKLAKGYARAGKRKDEHQQYIIQYLKSGPIADIENGNARVIGRHEDGSINAIYERERRKTPTTQWDQNSHNSEHYGTGILKSLLPGRQFPFPKSLYAVEDCIRFFVEDNLNAIVLDFFSGSGTTAHAVMRLNRQDGGRRQSILVTNNEVSADEQAALRGRGLRPGDHDWESQGICEYFTKPRLAAAVTGETPDGSPVVGNYKFIDEFPMAEGFEENVEFFTMTYEAPRPVAHNLVFKAMAPLLWLRAGSQGRRIEKARHDFDVADTYAVLFDLDASQDFLTAIAQAESVSMAFIVTDDDRGFQMVCGELPARVETVRLYESYLANFTINTGRE